MTEIKAVLFSDDPVTNTGTAVTISDFFAQLTRDPNCNKDQLYADWYSGRLTNNQFLAEFIRLADYRSNVLTTDDWKKLYSALGPARRRELFNFANHCRGLGLAVGSFSNLSTEVAEKLTLDDQYNGFNPVIASCEVGDPKPSLRMYLLAEARLGLEPSQILLLDASEPSIKAAEKRGWQAVKVNNVRAALAAARKLLGSR